MGMVSAKSHQAVVSRPGGRHPSPLGSSVGSMIPTLPFPASGQDSSSLTQTKTAELRDCKQPQVRSQHAQINPNAEETLLSSLKRFCCGKAAVKK